jgi:hypothetical protein
MRRDGIAIRGQFARGSPQWLMTASASVCHHGRVRARPSRGCGNRRRLCLRRPDSRFSYGVEAVTRILAILNVVATVGLAGCADLPDGTSPGTAAQGNGAGLSVGGQPLSAAARQVSQIAERNGDRDFIMLDKTHGKIIVFEHGTPTFSGAALTGENPADYLAPDAFSKTFAEQKGIRYKVTPAGRYTVSVGFDNAYGEILDVNEIQAKDWDIAIHKVWLGAPSEHRDARLRSARDQDKHITYGCIDVDGSTMEQLLARLPSEDTTPLYILPADENLIKNLFQSGTATRKVSLPAG